jgi:hypothetical protein
VKKPLSPLAVTLYREAFQSFAFIMPKNARNCLAIQRKAKHEQWYWLHDKRCVTGKTAVLLTR